MPDDELVAHCLRFNSIQAAALAIEPVCTDVVLKRRLQRIGRLDEVLAGQQRPSDVAKVGDLFDKQVHKQISAKGGATVEQIADWLDCAPRKVREALDRLRDHGYRVPDDDDTGQVVLQKVPPAKRNLHKTLLSGDEVTVGVVSDTHLCSKEHAREQLEAAYDTFVDRGISEVWHAGDLVAGRGIYRTQDQDLTHFTYEEQVAHAVETYPARDGVVTRLISGNHDIEGEFGKIGANPVAAVCNQRDDMEFLGDYSAHIELPNGAFAQLVHGRGGGSYAVSYKPQKWVEGLPAGRKPVLVVFGHWHIAGLFQHRNVNLLLGGCFEWQTSLLVRLGLQPQVGFWVLTMTLGDDGSLVRVVPEWNGFFEGRETVDSVAARIAA
jgi:predicted phosphodiesterase